MKYKIRAEEDKDYQEIYGLIETAFQTAQVKDGTEQDFATNLRHGEQYIPSLALVVELNDGRLIGHIMLTKTYVTKPDGTKFDALMLAPLCVALEYRAIGIGGALINRGFSLAKDMGYKAVFLCGNPEYYRRFGFKSIGDYGITHSSIPEPYVMGCELVSSALRGVNGVVRLE